MTDIKLLLEQLERLAIVLDEFMPLTAEVVRNAISLLREQDYRLRVKDKLSSFYGIREDENNG